MSKLGKSVLKLYGQLDARHNKARAEAGIVPVCKKGCSLCCYEHVDAFAIEVVPIADAINKMPLAMQNRLARRLREYVDAREDTDVLDVLTSVEDIDGLGFAPGDPIPTDDQLEKVNDKILAKAIRHRKIAWKTNTPCPFLEDNACTVYEARPYNCRSMVSVNEPDREVYKLGTAEIIRFDGSDFAFALFNWAKANEGNITDLTLPHGPLVGVLHHLLGDAIFEVEKENA